jgi:hypothetical protein
VIIRRYPLHDLAQSRTQLIARGRERFDFVKPIIAAGEDWEVRLGRLMEGADTVVFVISPDSVASERCAWEVERTVKLKKRLLPIVWHQDARRGQALDQIVE